LFSRQAVALPQKKRALRGRRLVAVDIENIVGSAVLTSADATWARRSIEEAIKLESDEQVVIGASPTNVMSTWLGWAGPRIVMRSGAHGPVLALLDVLSSERIAERFDRVVLASGDGAFADAVARLASEGVNVTVLARRERLSKRLRMATGGVVLFRFGVAGLGDVA
jgi:hypothetical protein